MSGYRGGLGEGEDAQKVRALVVLEKEQHKAGTVCATLAGSLLDEVTPPSVCSQQGATSGFENLHSL